MENKDDFLSISDVSKMLNINKATIYKMAKNNEMHFIKIGKLWRIKREDVTKLFKQSTEEIVP